MTGFLVSDKGNFTKTELQQAIKKYEQQPDVLSDKQRNLAKSINKMKMVFNL